MNFTEENPLSVSSVGAAVRKNDVEALRQSIEKGRSIDLKDNRGWAAIHCAASLDYTDCLTVLLKAGADVNIRTHEGETPLFLACARECHQAVDILLESNSAVNFSNNEKVTPLHIVACGGFDDLATKLLNKKANVNAQDYGLDTPLLEAVRHGHINMCSILLSHKADQSICDYNRNLPIHYACQEGNLEILKILLQNSKDKNLHPNKVVNWLNQDGYSPLMLAVQSRNLSSIEELFQYGADANVGVCFRYGSTALHLAAYYGNLPILKVVLNATSKETIKQFCSYLHGKQMPGILFGQSKSNLICNAILSESEDCLEYLLDYGFDSNVLNAPFEITNPITCLLSTNKFNPFALRALKLLLKTGYNANPNMLYKKWDMYYSPKPFYNFIGSNDQMELVEAAIQMLVEHGLDIDFFLHSEISHLFFCCIESACFKIIPYLLQRSLVVEPNNVLKYILGKAQYHTSHNFSTLAIFLSHYVDPSNITKYSLQPSKFTNLIQFIKSNTIETTQSHIYLSHMISFPSLKGMARSVIRQYIHGVCGTNSHQFKVKLNSLPLPEILLSYLNYGEMQTFYESLENNLIHSLS